jgi:hypothetical protein
MRAQGENSDFAANIRPLVMSRRAALGGNWTSGGEADLHRAGGEGVGREQDADEDGAAAANSEGSMGTFVMGMVLGWALGILMLLLAVNPRVSRRFKQGLLVGVTLNVLTALTIDLWTSNGKAGTGGQNTIPPAVQSGGSWTGTSPFMPVDIGG